MIFKPFFDVSIGLVAAVIFLPVFLLTVFGLLVFNKGSVFFVQNRVGLKGRIFMLYKFKTMTDAKDHQNQLLPDEERLTWIGKMIRNLSLDELPQLFNVLTGNMSIVGPRPLLVEYLPLYNVRQQRRHDVKPGITGWAQVNGRNSIAWTQKFELDVWYVDNVSFWLDIRILFLTVKKVLKSEGISSETSATMEKFRGNENS
jgi:undecaprenyl phosphate N,N'-diacetylbacillosamine 1-phosphate transferase